MVDSNYSSIIIADNHKYIEYHLNNKILKIRITNPNYLVIRDVDIQKWESPYSNEYISQNEKITILFDIFKECCKTNDKVCINFVGNKEFTLLGKVKPDLNYCNSKSFENIKEVNTRGLLHIWGKKYGAYNELDIVNLKAIEISKDKNLINIYLDNKNKPTFIIQDASDVSIDRKYIGINDCGLIYENENCIYFKHDKWILKEHFEKYSFNNELEDSQYIHYIEKISNDYKIDKCFIYKSI